MKYQAQGFDQFPMINAYQIEEENFLKTVKIVPISDVPDGANVIGSHVLYKVKKNDDESLKLKSRIAPHGNEDDLKEELTTDCAVISPLGLRIVQSIAALFGWPIDLGDVKTAFLKSGEAEREVYVIPPNESGMRATHRWLLLAAAYGLVNSNAKWQHRSDDQIMNKLGLKQCKHIQQLFYLMKDGQLILLVAKLVDDIMATGRNDNGKKFLKAFGEQFELGSTRSGPGNLRFYGINVTQNENFKITTNADDKLNSLYEFNLSRERRRDCEQDVNQLERRAFMSLNSSLSWIGSAASPMCSFYSSYLQQKCPNIKVKHIIEQ